MRFSRKMTGPDPGIVGRQRVGRFSMTGLGASVRLGELDIASAALPGVETMQPGAGPWHPGKLTGLNRAGTAQRARWRAGFIRWG